MEDKSYKQFSELNNYSKVIIILAAISYLLFTSYIYAHYNQKAITEKEKLVDHYYDKLIEIATSNIHDLLLTFSSNPEIKDIRILLKNYNMELCSEETCVNYDLFKFGLLINSYIPKYIHYKLALNDHPIYSNYHEYQYKIDKYYNISNNIRFRVNIDVDHLFWKQKEMEIKKPFWDIFLFITTLLIVVCLVYRMLISNVSNYWKSYYQQKHEQILCDITSKYNKEFQALEDSILQKQWDLDFAKKKDLEINYLFAQEANQIAYIEGIKDGKISALDDYNYQNIADKVPCSIILLKQGEKEILDIAQIKKMFEQRFSTEEEKLIVNTTDYLKVVEFSSLASFYQIIYSITSYLFFILKSGNKHGNKEVKLTIDLVNKKLLLRFEFDLIEGEGEEILLQSANKFFKTHANPFLLDINQIKNLLQVNGFDFNIDILDDRRNILEIIEQKKDEVSTEDDNKVISLYSLKSASETKTSLKRIKK
ncbi:MAG: hypothetical protein SFT68_00395 [Rickettsiaceae bacterium]|nr:hypothetical protein [Rickettsiaceae bacterium]